MRKAKQLENRIESLENDLRKAVERIEALEKEREEASLDMSMSRLMQEGIDNIMGYQGPRAKGGNK